MSDVTSLLLTDARLVLIRELEESSTGSSVERQFAQSILKNFVPSLSIRTELNTAVKVTGAKRTYQHVAIMGFAAWSGLLDEAGKAALLDGIDWTVGRAPVVDNVQMPFCRDVVALLGIALGVSAFSNEELKTKGTDWLRTAVKAGRRDREFDVWEQCLLNAISGLFPDLFTPDIQRNRDFDADVQVGLQSCGLLPLPPTAEAIYENQLCALRLIQSETCPKIGIARSALRLVALESVKASQTTLQVRSISKQDVAALLRRFPAALKLWTWEDKPRTKTPGEPRRWDIDNEYHVQNLLWFLLAPLFPDLTNEEYTAKLGPVQPRADLGIPSLRFLIEAKFMRVKDPAKKVIEEVAQDASLYLTRESKYDSILAFIWDDSRRIELHEEIIKGLRAIEGVEDAVIVPRPGKMSE